MTRWKATRLFLCWIMLLWSINGCAGRSAIMPTGMAVTQVPSFRYLDLWHALRMGKGVLIGTQKGNRIVGSFVSAGGYSITISTSKGRHTEKISNITYLVNVIDLSRSREAALVGGLLGAPLGFSIAYGSQRAASSNTFAAKGAQDAYGADEESSSGESTTSDANASATGGANDTASSGESSTSSSDATEVGSNTYSGESGSSSESSSGETTSSSSGSSLELTVVGNGQSSSGSGGSSSAEDRDNGNLSGSNSPNSTPSQRWARRIAYTVGFAALGALIGWAVGKAMRRSTPRVDFVIFEEHYSNKDGVTSHQYLADRMAPTVSTPAASLIPQGAVFENAASARRFEMVSQVGSVVNINPLVGEYIDIWEARRYGLFSQVQNLERAFIVRAGPRESRLGREAR